LETPVFDPKTPVFASKTGFFDPKTVSYFGTYFPTIFEKFLRVQKKTRYFLKISEKISEL